MRWGFGAEQRLGAGTPRAGGPASVCVCEPEAVGGSKARGTRTAEAGRLRPLIPAIQRVKEPPAEVRTLRAEPGESPERARREPGVSPGRARR